MERPNLRGLYEPPLDEDDVPVFDNSLFGKADQAEREQDIGDAFNAWYALEREVGRDRAYYLDESYWDAVRGMRGLLEADARRRKALEDAADAILAEDAKRAA